MKFYHLTNPVYGSDQERSRANPIRISSSNWIPGLICSQCGTWAATRRLYLPLTNPSITKFLSLPPLTESDWKQNLDEIRKLLNVPNSFKFLPGDRLGVPDLELRRNKFNMIMHPFPGQIIVTEEVLHVFNEAKITGYSPVEASVKWSSSVKENDVTLARLYELKITGHAWRGNYSLDNSIACGHCQRPIFLNPNYLTIDESRWDGSDMFTLDMNHNIVMVTERVCAILGNRGFRNYVCKSSS